MKKFNNNNAIRFRRTEKITYIAVLASIAIVLNIVEINLGVGDIKLSLSYLPCFISGIFLGPFAGLSVGLLGDVVGALIMPQGAWIPLITLGSGLMGLIPGLIFKIKKLHPFIKLPISLILVFCICTAGVNSLGIFLVYISGKQAFLVWWSTRLISQSMVMSVNAVILFIIYYPFDKLIFARLRKTDVTATDIGNYDNVDKDESITCDTNYSNLLNTISTDDMPNGLDNDVINSSNETIDTITTVTTADCSDNQDNS